MSFFLCKKCLFLINVSLGSLQRETTNKTIFAKYKYNRLSTEEGDRVLRKGILTSGGRTHCDCMRSAFVPLNLLYYDMILNDSLY